MSETKGPSGGFESDQALLEACRAREVRAFERLYETHGAKMKSLAMNLLRDRGDAEDAVQETFLKMYRAAPSFRGSAKLSTWAYRVLVNACHDLGRQRARRGRDVVESLPGEGAELPAVSADHPLRLDLEAALAALDEKRRTVFLLSEVEGFSHREVGEILGVAEGTSRALLLEARRRLQKALSRAEGSSA